MVQMREDDVALIMINIQIMSKKNVAILLRKSADEMNKIFFT